MISDFRGLSLISSTLLMPLGARTPGDIDIAAAMCADYSDRRGDNADIVVRIHADGGETERAIKPSGDRTRYQQYLL